MMKRIVNEAFGLAVLVACWAAMTIGFVCTALVVYVLFGGFVEAILR